MKNALETNDIIRLIFVVTTKADVWKVGVEEKNGIIRALVEKIAHHGIPSENYYSLKRGDFVELRPEKLALFYMPQAQMGDLPLELPGDNSKWNGCAATGEITALFFNIESALLCSTQVGLSRNDARWEDITEEVVRSIGLGHPFFCIPTGYMDSFNNCHDLGLKPEKRKILKPQSSKTEETFELSDWPQEKQPKDTIEKQQLKDIDLGLVQRAVRRLKKDEKSSAPSNTKVERTIKPHLPKTEIATTEKIPQPLSKPSPLKPDDVGEGKTFVLVVEREIKLHHVFPTIDRGNTLKFRSGKYSMEMVCVDKVKYYVIKTITGFYGKSVGDFETICKVEKTEESTTLTYV